MRWVRAAARTRWSSRSRTVPASSNRSCSDSAAIRASSASVTGRASPVSRPIASPTTAAYSCDALPPRAGRAAPAHLAERALGAVTTGRELAGALSQRHDLVDGGDGGLGGALGPERAEVAGTVGLDLAHDRQPREQLVRQLDPDDALGVPGAPVVARLVGGDEAQLADLRLQRGLADDRLDARRQADHLGHPGPLLGRGEVGAGAGADVARRADVERPAALVLEDVDPGQRRQVLGEEPLATLGRA